MLSSDHIHRIGGFLLRVALAGCLGMVLALEFAAAVRDGDTFAVAVTIPGLAAIAMVLFAEGHLPQWAFPVAALSLALSVLGCVLAEARVPSFAEAGALLVLSAWTIRRWEERHGRVAVALLAISILALPLRGGSWSEIMVANMLVTPLLLAAAAFGAYLYNMDFRRRRALEEVRRGERLELARELHDFVAHHVTGMVVRAQAAQYIPEADASGAQEAFAAIENAGVEALASMRRLVAVMRDAEQATEPHAAAGLRQTVELVEQFQLEGVAATCQLGPEVVEAELPPEISGSIHRIVRESLTNVRKHAVGATAVTVAVKREGERLEITVHDDGRPGRRSRFPQADRGFGLAGLCERVAMIGGEMSAGPLATGGWQVRASVPSATSLERQEKP